MTQHTSSGRPAIVGLEALTPAPATANPRPSRTVAVVTPCFNRKADLELLLADLAAQRCPRVTMYVVVVDNASSDPLSTCRVPEGLSVEFLRLPRNTGGSGGYSAGMARVVAGEGLAGQHPPADYVWWIDSDARVAPEALRELVRVLEKRPDVGIVGSGLKDIVTGRTWEVGGIVERHSGLINVAARGDLDRRHLVKGDYVAACSALVRREAIEKTGLFPENFIYYDDVDWCLWMTRATGLKVRAAVKSRAYHPPSDRRFMTWARYYGARNAFNCITILNLPRSRYFKRAMHEVRRAVAQRAMGLDEIADLHMRGLRDAVARVTTAYEPRDLLKPLGFKPYSGLVAEVRDALAKAGPGATLYVHPALRKTIPGMESLRPALRELNVTFADASAWKHRTLHSHPRRDLLGAAWRVLTGPSASVAIVPTGWPSAWFRGATVIQVTSEGYLMRKTGRVKQALAAASTLLEGVLLGWKLMMNPPPLRSCPKAPSRVAEPVSSVASGAGQGPARAVAAPSTP